MIKIIKRNFSILNIEFEKAEYRINDKNIHRMDLQLILSCF